MHGWPHGSSVLLWSLIQRSSVLGSDPQTLWPHRTVRVKYSDLVHEITDDLAPACPGAPGQEKLMLRVLGARLGDIVDSASYPWDCFDVLS